MSISNVGIRNSFLSFIFLFTWSPLWSQVVYVATNGSDSNSGTLSEPFKTIQKAADAIGSNGTVYIREGRYHESVFIENNHPGITFEAYNSEKVILDGTKPVTSSWEVHSGNIYKTKIDEGTWQVFVNDKMHVTARWPNIGNPTDEVNATGGHGRPNFPPPGSYYDTDNWHDININACSVEPADDSTGLHVTLDDPRFSQISGVDLTGAVIVGKLQKHNHFSHEIINYHSGNKIKATTDYFKLREGDNADNQNGFQDVSAFFFLEDKLEFLDEAGEWWYDEESGYLYLWCLEDKNPNNEEVRYKVYDCIFETKGGCHDYVFKGITFFGGRLWTDGSHNYKFIDCTHSHTVTTSRSLSNLDVSKHRHISYFRQCPEGHDFNGAVDFLFDNNVFEYIDGCALNFHGSGTAGTKITNCLFHHILWDEGRQGATYAKKCTGGEFSYCTVHTLGKGNGHKPGSQEDVYMNRVHNIYFWSDASTIQVAPGGQEGTRLHHNWTYNSNTANGIRFDGKEGEHTEIGGLLDHNVVKGCKRGYRLKGEEHQIYNNMGIECHGESDMNVAIAKGGNLYTQTYNNCAGVISGGSDRWQPIPGNHGNNWNGCDTTREPMDFIDGVADQPLRTQLMDPDNFDFRPCPGSDLIDAGIIKTDAFKNVNVTEGWIGDAPDIGPYEFGDDQYWIPGRRIDKASYPVPIDNGPKARVISDLMWAEARNSTSFDVYFGERADNLSKVATNPAGNNIYDPGYLACGRTYFWRVDCHTPSGIKTGDVWSFTVKEKDTIYFAATDDAFIESGNSSNYGDSAYLELSNSKTGYLKFKVEGLENHDVESSFITMRLSASGSDEKQTSLHKVSDNSWSESSINGNNFPSVISEITSLNNIQKNTRAIFNGCDVSGNGEYSYAIKTTSEIEKWYAEEALHNPKLHVVVTGGPDNSSDSTNSDSTSNSISTYYNPQMFRLEQNYPNPFNITTEIKFQLKQSGIVRLAIYNLGGQLVETLIDNQLMQSNTYHIVEWDASAFKSGVYFYRLETGNFSKTIKCVLLK